MSLFNIWKGWIKLEMSREVAYRANYFFKAIAMFTFGIVGPLVAMIIYSVSRGIPGWSFEEFLLLTGVFVFVAGINHLFFQAITWHTVHAIREGEYDVNLVKPVSPLMFATITAVNLDGLTRTFLGAFVIVYALVKMGWVFSLINFLGFVFLILLALLFMYSIDILIAALAFLVVKSYALLDIFREFLAVGQNPLTIYGATGMLVFTFIFPVGLAAFYPASAILGKIPTLTILYLAAIAFGFFVFVLLIWNLAIKKYSSAGG